MNGEAISLDEYTEHMGVKQTAEVMSGRGPTEVRVLGNFGLQALQELIDQRVLLQMAKEANLLPTEAEVDAELKLQEALQPSYSSVLHSQGLTDKMIRNELRIGLARQHMIMNGITIQPEEVDRYIKAHQDKFMTPAKAALLVIRVKSAATKARVDAELSSGKKFDDVAREVNPAQQTQAQGAMYPISIVSQMPKNVQDAIKGTPLKATTGWVVDGAISSKFYVVDKQPSVMKPPSPEARELVRRAIAMEQGALKNDFDHKFFLKLRAATVNVEIPYLKEPWAKAWDQLSAPTEPNRR